MKRTLVALIPSLVISAQLGATPCVGAQSASAQPAKPYVLDRGKELGLSLVGAGLLAAGLVVQNGQDPLTPEQVAALDPGDINALDRPATERWSTGADQASDVLLLAMVASPAVLAVTEINNGNGLTLGLMYAETMLLNNGIVQLFKGVTNRTRPFAYNDDPTIPDEKRSEISARRSFPSGHTANAFAAAVFLGTTYARLHPESNARKWVWAGSLTAATSVGILRYAAGKHFPTDIVTGAVVGASLGYFVPKLHDTKTVYVIPSSAGVGVGTVLRF